MPVPRWAPLGFIEPLLTPWMELPMNRLELAPIDLSVDLGRGDGGMPQHLLNDSEVGTSRKKVGGEGVAELVRMDGLLDAGQSRIVADELPDPGRGEWMAPDGKKDFCTGSGSDQFGARDLEIGLQGGKSRTTDRNQACFVPFAGDADHPSFFIKVFQSDVTGFSDAKTAGIEKFQKCPVANLQGAVSRRG